MLILSSLLSGQNSEIEPCGFDPSSFEVQLLDAAFDQFHSEQPSFLKLAEMDTLTFTIRMTVFREDNGEMPLTGTTTREPITQENIDLVLSNLNSVYAPIKVKFVHDGRINYIDNSKLLQEKSISVNFISFTSSNVNLKIFPIGSAGSAGNLYVNGIDGPFGNGGITILDSDFF